METQETGVIIIQTFLLNDLITQIFDGIDSSSQTHMLPILGYTVTQHQLPLNFLSIKFKFSWRFTLVVKDLKNHFLPTQI